MNRMINWMLVAFIAVTVIGCAGIKEDKTQSTEELLSAAGFKMVPAQTPDDIKRLNALTPHRIEFSVRDNKPLYWYADPTECQCVFTGDQEAYGRYEKLRLASNIADQEEQTAIMNEDAAMEAGMWGWLGGPWGW